MPLARELRKFTAWMEFGQSACHVIRACGAPGCDAGFSMSDESWERRVREGLLCANGHRQSVEDGN